MSPTDCISEDQLRALVLGEVSEQDAGPLEEHLLECPQCVARTRALRSGDRQAKRAHLGRVIGE
jgi:anti-sigma factor RsiW